MSCKLYNVTTQLFAKYMLARLNSSKICTSTLSLIGSFWLSEGVYPGFWLPPPKVGITVRYVKNYLHWVFRKLLLCEIMFAEKGQKLRYFNLPPNMCVIPVLLDDIHFKLLWTLILSSHQVSHPRTFSTFGHQGQTKSISISHGLVEPLIRSQLDSQTSINLNQVWQFGGNEQKRSAFPILNHWLEIVCFQVEETAEITHNLVLI